MICMPIITNSSIDTDAYFAQLRYRLSGAGKRASLAFSMAEKLIKFWVFFTLLLIGAPGSCAGFKPMLSLCYAYVTPVLLLYLSAFASDKLIKR